MRPTLTRTLLTGVSLVAMLPATGRSTEPLPRLILQITVDQLRGDLLNRHANEFGDGGFRYLLDRGTVYLDAHHDHANTETIVGHTTLATGAHPSTHGMIGNVWLDRETGELVYNIEDARYPLLTAGAGVDRDTEIDPTQAVAGTEGRSPAAIQVTTFSDELALRFARRSKIFGVSVKDRGAVSMAGHAGKAFWFSKATGELVTSAYYYDELPPWVAEWNRRRRPDRFGDTTWSLLADPATYLFWADDDQPWETDLAGFGRTFPHPYGPADGKYFTTLLTVSPAGDDLTLDFAKTLFVAEELGRDEIPDYLSISFSSTDYVGHLFGPSSLEAEDNLRRLDRTLAELFAFVDEMVGLERTLIVLSADHGAPEAPGLMNELGVEARYVDPDAWDKDAAFAALRAELGLGEELIETYFHPYLYLDREAIERAELDPAVVEDAVCARLVAFPGVAAAIPSRSLLSGSVPDTALNRKIFNNFHPTRSGDIFVVFDPHSFVNDFDGLVVASTHGMPWNYDTYVPIIFAGYGLEARRVTRRVLTIDLAPTLAAIVGAKPPSGAAGTPLAEVFGSEDD